MDNPPIKSQMMNSNDNTPHVKTRRSVFSLKK